MSDTIHGRFIWRKAKAALVLRSHKLALRDVCIALDDPNVITRPNDDGSTDERWVSVGMAGSRLCTVVHKDEGNFTRIITAWRSTEQEHDDYYTQR